MSKVWYVSTGGNNNNNGTSWSSPRKTITSALTSAASGDSIWVKAGTYSEQLTLGSGVALLGGFAGTETAEDQRDWSTNTTTVNPGSGSAVTIAASASSATRLDGFTLTGGARAVYVNSGGSPQIAHNVITNNRRSTNNYSAFTDGAIYVSSASPTITDNLIARNSYTAGYPSASAIGAGITLVGAGSALIVNLSLIHI